MYDVNRKKTANKGKRSTYSTHRKYMFSRTISRIAHN